MTDTGGSDQATEDDIAVEIEDPGAQNYDPHQYVPEFFDPMTASGLVRMHEALNDENAATLRTQHPTLQAHHFWKMVEAGHITPASGQEVSR